MIKQGRELIVNHFKYDESNISDVYDNSRSLSYDVIDVWMDAVKSALGKEEIIGIVDLGSGTGRFTSALATAFNTYCIGVDPSEKMLTEAKRNSKGNVSFFVGSGESIPVTTKVGMVYMSMTYHHLLDVDVSMQEIQRILNPDGYLVIRNATQEDIIDNGEFQFFPRALEIEMKRMPLRDVLISAVCSTGFECVYSTRVKQCFAKSYDEFYQKIRLRGLSALRMISDKEFENGLVRLKKFCEEKPPTEPVMDKFHLLIFRQGLKTNRI